MNRLLSSSLLCSVGFLAACSDAPVTEPPAPLVLVMTIAEDTAEAPTRVLAGVVESRTQADVAFLVPGRIATRRVEVGDRVRAGQALMTLAPEDYAAGLAASAAQMKAAGAETQLAAGELARLTALRDSGAISALDYERQEARATASAAQFAQAQQQHQLAQQRLGYATVRAPFAGTVTRVAAEVGTVVAEGLPVVSVSREDQPEIVVDVPEDLANQLPRTPQTAVIPGLPAALRDTPIRLRELSPAASLPLRSYRARFQFEGLSAAARQAVRLGMTAEVRLSSPASYAEHVVLPASALMSDGRNQSVWVAAGQPHQLKRQTVTVTRHGDAGVQVQGLKAGQHVVIAGTDQLIAGQTVRLMHRSGTAYEPDVAP